MEVYCKSRNIKVFTTIILITILITARQSAGFISNKPDKKLLYTENKKAALTSIIKNFEFITDKQKIYYNGITLKEAIRSSQDIERLALKLTNYKDNTSYIMNINDEGAKNNIDIKSTALAIYEWITQTIVYEHKTSYQNTEKGTEAEKRAGALYAFNNQKGDCFDFSTLFASMCITAGIRCRLITGLAFTGEEWAPHAWNSFYIPYENRWVEVDTAFGTVENYFDNKKFEQDHMLSIIQGEW